MTTALSAYPDRAAARIAASLLAFGVLALGGSVAHAQNAEAVESITISGLTGSEYIGTLPTGTSREATINIEACQVLLGDRTDELTFGWTFKSTPPSGAQYVVKFQRRTETCAASSLQVGTDECLRAHAPRALAETVSATVAVADYFGDELDAPAKCFDEALGGAFSAILVFEEDSLDTTEFEVVADTITLNIDLDRPDAPTGVTARGGESGARVSWDAVTGASYYEIYVAESAEELLGGYPEDLPMNGRRSDGTTREISGLTTGVTYYVAVVSVDESDNRSLVSEATEFTTSPSDDFWELYRGAGGVESGGCASSHGRTPSGGALLLLGAALGAFVLRRRKSALVALLFAGVALAPASADASIDYDYEEDIRAAFELKLGPYTPNIDDEFGGDGPYNDVFGGSTPLLLEAEFDYQFWRGFGSLGVFGAVGWSQVRASAIGVDGEPTADKTRLRMLPLRLGLVYRFDELQRRWNIPFVFSFKAGLDYSAWFVMAGNQIADAADPDGTRHVGRGGTFGYHAALGVNFLLDSLAPRMATTFAANSGVDNSYLFAELMMARIDDFGSDDSWDLGTRTFLIGLAFEF